MQRPPPTTPPHTEMQAPKGGGFVYPSSEFPDALVWVLQRNRISGSLKILSWQAGHPGEPVEWVPVWVWDQRQKINGLAWRKSGRRSSPWLPGGSSLFALLRFSADWMSPPPPPLWRAFAFLCPWIQMLFSSGNTLAHRPRMMFGQISGQPMAQSSDA